MAGRTRLDRLVVIDLEMTCWEADPPPGQQSDVISIGAVELVLDEQEPRLGRTFERLVKPERSDVSDFCTRLTGLTPAMLRRAPSFIEACSALNRTLGGSSKSWGGWGDDRTALLEGAARHGITPPLEGPYIDLGALWGMLMGAQRSIGLRQALSMQGLEFDGTPHRALSDAVNAARIVSGVATTLRASFEPMHRPARAVKPAEPTDEAGPQWGRIP